jgi:hypothetical protein
MLALPVAEPRDDRTDRLAEVRAKAAQHDDEIASVKWLTVADLAARWRVSGNTVRAIPATELRYKEFGAGAHLKRRRYKPEWVTAYEDVSARSPDTHDESAA